METDFVNSSSSVPEDVSAYMKTIVAALGRKAFVPHSLFKSGHAQTIAGYAWPRRSRFRAHTHDEARLFEVAPDVRLLAHCRWQEDKTTNAQANGVMGEGNEAPTRRDHPTIVLLHGLEGSSASIYLLGTAEKAFAAGFNVVRVNMRNCGETEHLAPTLYNSGMSGDMCAIVAELIERDKLSSIFLAGFSMGGNIILKLAGEYGSNPPPQVKAICAVSPAIDLAACADKIAHRSNIIYQRRFLRGLRRRMHRKAILYPERYDLREFRRVRTIRDFDNVFTARDGGYIDAADYYARSSALAFIPHICVPTLILHAQDDPFIPFDAFNHRHIRENPYIALLTPQRGGHVGFVAAGRAANDEDVFWAENRIVDFCRMIHRRRTQSN